MNDENVQMNGYEMNLSTSCEKKGTRAYGDTVSQDLRVALSADKLMKPYFTE